MTREARDHGIRFCIVCVLAVWGGLLFSFESRARGPMDNALALFLSVCFLIFYLLIPLLAQILFIFNTPNCRRKKRFIAENSFSPLTFPQATPPRCQPHPNCCM